MISERVGTRSSWPDSEQGVRDRRRSLLSVDREMREGIVKKMPVANFNFTLKF